MRGGVRRSRRLEIGELRPWIGLGEGVTGVMYCREGGSADRMTDWYGGMGVGGCEDVLIVGRLYGRLLVAHHIHPDVNEGIETPDTCILQRS